MRFIALLLVTGIPSCSGTGPLLAEFRVVDPAGQPIPGAVVFDGARSCLTDDRGHVRVNAGVLRIHKPGYLEVRSERHSRADVRLATTSLSIDVDARGDEVPWKVSQRSGERIFTRPDGRPSAGQVWVTHARKGLDPSWREWVAAGHTACLVVGPPSDLEQDLASVRDFLAGSGLEVLSGVIWPVGGEPGGGVPLLVGRELGISGVAIAAYRPGRLGGRSPARMLAATAMPTWTVMGAEATAPSSVTWVAGAGPLGAGKVTVLVDSSPLGSGSTPLLEALLRY